MSRSRLAFFAVPLVLSLSGCATQGPTAPEPMQSQVFPPAFAAQEIVGRWGLAAYHKPDDRARTETAALNQCKQPYNIALGPTGGVMMHLADQPQPQELRLKGSADRKTFIGPDGEPGGQPDREVVSFDGRVLILRWIDGEVQGRYGNAVYVRCPPEGQQPRPPARTAKPKPKPAAS